YRYNFVKNKIEKTGILVLDSEPNGATVFIDEKKQKKSTETRIKNLLPDTYLVRVEKEGYYAWEKILEIKSKLTTFAENILLFKESVPMQIVDGEISEMSLSSDEKMLAYVLENTLRLYDLKNSDETEIYKSYSQIVGISWSADNEKILIEEKYYPHFKVIDVSDEGKIFVPKNHFGINFTELRWDENDGDILYGLKPLSLKAGTLYKINLADEKTGLPIPIGNAFIVDGDSIYTTNYINKNDFLYKRSFDNPEDTEEIAMLPVGNYEFVSFEKNRLTLLHKDRGELVYINLDDSNENTILESWVTDSIWANGNINKLLIKKDFEILVQNFETRKRELITRYSKEIVKTLWHPEGNYIFFSMNDKIQVIELDSRGGTRNKITLVDFDEIGDFVLDKDAEKIYFTGKVGAQEGIYELGIQ
ncbi:MAG: PEGA domain-containing protein, partial [Parcubacteria group bacterium]|nr:PEGA domain-containing protein [Parcubacteria group bacterium]